MTTAPDGHCSLSEDLLADLKQGAPRTPTRPVAPAEPAAPAAVSRAAVPAAPRTPTVEVRITPRAWSPAGVAPLPDGGGLAVSLGPLRVSLWRNRG
jgi:hypothetical protein